MLFFQLKPDGVVPWVGHVGQPIDHPKREEDGGVGAEGGAGSPFSILFKVMRLMEARSARIATGIRRRRRASRMSWPSLRRARATGRGVMCGRGGLI